MLPRDAHQAGDLTLWLRRTDATGSQYNHLAASSTETVSQLRRRFAAQAKLGCDPGLVSLHLVYRGPDMLTKDPGERKAAEKGCHCAGPFRHAG